MRRGVIAHRFFVLSAVLYAGAQGASTGASAWSNLESSNIYLAWTVGLIAFMIRTTTAAYFQGPIILNGGEKKADADTKEDTHRLQRDQSFLTNPEVLHSGSYQEIPPELTLNPRLQFGRRVGAGLFCITDMALNFSDHYFIWRQLSLLYLNLTDAVFWPLLPISFMIQQFFYMTNEGYETINEIQSPPFYQDHFPFTAITGEHQRTRNWVCRIGSLHHIIFELLAWLISLESVVRWASREPQRAVPLGLGLLLLVVLGYYQTRIFEGRATEEHFAGSPQRSLTLTSRARTLLETTLPAMALFHGANSATPVCVVLTQQLSLPIGMGVSLAIFGVTANGTYWSEVKTALREIRRVAATAEENVYHADRATCC